MLGFLKKADKGVELIQLVFSCIIMFAIMWLTFAMVFWRYVLNNSIVWAEEILRYLMMWAVLVGAGLTTREDQHVSMDVLQTAIARWPKLRAIHYLITRVIVFGFMIYLIGPTLELMEKAGSATATSVTWLHKSVIYASFLAGTASVCLSLLSQVPKKIKSILKNEETDELIIEAREKAAQFEAMLNAENNAAATPDEAAEDNKDGGKDK